MQEEATGRHRCKAEQPVHIGAGKWRVPRGLSLGWGWRWGYRTDKSLNAFDQAERSIVLVVL